MKRSNMTAVNSRNRERRLTIGLITNDVAGQGPYQEQLWRGVVAGARKHGVNLLTIAGGLLERNPADEFVYQRNLLFDLIEKENLDGFVIGTQISSFVTPEKFKDFCLSFDPIPVVGAGFYFDGIPGVVVDSEKGLQEAISHLVEGHGYRRIGFIQGPKGSDADERYEAYVKSLSDYGIMVDPNLIAPGDYQPSSGRQAVELFIDERGLQPHVDVEAIVAANDNMAWGALLEFRDRGIRVPGDVAIVGFDDSDEARASIPAMTTVRQPIFNVGESAIDLLLALMDGESVQDRNVLPTEVVLRQSCGCFHPSVVEAGSTSSSDGTGIENVADALEGMIGDEDAARWAARLVDALNADLHPSTDDEEREVLVLLNELIRRTLMRGEGVEGWHDVVSALRMYALSQYADSEEGLQAVDLCQQARVLVGEMGQQNATRESVGLHQQSLAMNDFIQNLATTFKVEILTDMLAQQLPQLGVDGCILSLFDGRQDGSETNGASRYVETVLAYTGQERMEQIEGLRYFSSDLLPQKVISQDDWCHWVIYTIYSQEDLLGLVGFQPGVERGDVYSTLRTQLGASLKTALLVREAESRALQLQTAAEVSRAASSILDPDELIQQVVELAQDRFDLYYAGLFLVDDEGNWTDEPGRWAVLRAGTGKAGEAMLTAGHKLEIGGESMVGWCIENLEPRIALDVGDEAVRFDNPHLPDTRSELALPLVSRGTAVGALTIQSSEEAAFTDADIAVLQTMADQLSNAIVNARLFGQAQEELVERRRAEERLGYERDLLRFLMNSSPDYIFFKDRGSRFIRTNEAHAQDLLGLEDPQDAIGKTDFDFFPAEEAQRAYDEEQHIMETCEPVVDREWQITVKGEQIWVSEHKLPLVEDNEVLGLLGISRDITARREAEISLKRRALQLQTAAEVSQAVSSILKPERLMDEVVHLIQERFNLYYTGLFLTDETGEWAVLRAGTGEAGERMLEDEHRLEVGSGSMIGWSIENQEARIALDVGEDAVRFDNPYLPETRSELALPLVSRGETIGALTIQSTEEAAFSDEDIAVLQTMADQLANALQNAQLYNQAQAEIEERRRTEKALADQQHLLQTFMDSVPENIYFKDKESRFIQVNRALLEWHGLSDPSEIIGKTDFDLFAEEHAAEAYLDEQRVMETEEPVEKEEREVWPDGRVTWVMTTKMPLYDAEGNLMGTFGVSRDITERRLAEEALREANEELEQYAESLQQRSEQLEAAAEVAQEAATILDVDELLDEVVTLISDRFGFYHTGAFLTDDSGEYVVLKAASSEGGRRMLAQAHKLPVGERGIVGHVAAENEPRIALDVGEDAVFFDNPDLPDTRSEMALPLTVRGEVIGVLDVQSAEPSAFSEEDVTILQTMAGQIAAVIDNARLIEQTQDQLQELQILQGQFSATAWSELLSPGQGVNYVYDRVDVQRVDDLPSSVVNLALEQGETMSALGDDGQDKALATPIRIRDELVGVLGLQDMSERRDWSSSEVSLLEAVSDQVGMALENARLFEEAQRRAAQLAAAAEVARDATAILDTDQLLSETVDLISEQFGFYHAGVFLLDNEGRYAVLQAASSEGGERMLAREHRLEVGKVGIVGDVAASGEPRIVNDVGEDAEYFDNPDLPDTKSELALPLRAQDEIIGVLDVQSTRLNAFVEDDVAVLQTLADQLATAIANARLFRQVREDARRRALINEVIQAVSQSLDIYQIMSMSGEVISRRLEMPSVLFEWETHEDGEARLRVVSIHDPDGEMVIPSRQLSLTSAMAPAMFKAVRSQDLQTSFRVLETVDGDAAVLGELIDLVDAAYVPLMSRGQPIGLLMLGRQRGHPQLDEGELSFLEIVAANLGVALENARLYEEAVETAERLKEVDQLKSQFLANMSHELRTPLNSIIGFSRVILKGIDGPLTDMQRTDLESVHESGKHLLGLINDILDLSKIEAGKMELSIEEVDLNGLISGVMATAKALVKDKPEIDLQQDVPDDLPVVQADERRIRQILLNLVSNAAKFTEEGYIRVGAELEGGCVLLSVADTGIGIPDEKMDVLFEKFTQVDSSTTRRFGGTGLGLPITREFVEMHGGEMWVESEVGEGSTFYFTIPLEEPVEEEEDLPELEPGERLVVCVEDDEGVITLFRRYLNGEGYRVVGISDSTQAVKRIRELKPFAITLDVMMPGMDGWQILQELKKHSETRHIPVIVCTIVGEKERGLSMGAADYLMKPILEEDLVSALERLDHRAEHQRVLVVDDQDEDRELLCRLIEAEDGYEVIEASGGMEAIELVREKKPHLVVLDLLMPEVDGFAVVEALKADRETRSVPIIVVTGKELSDEDVERLNSGVAGLLEKGLFEQEELLADVAAELNRLARPEEEENNGAE